MEKTHTKLRGVAVNCANCGKQKEPVYICTGIEDYQLVHECLKCMVVAAERRGAESVCKAIKSEVGLPPDVALLIAEKKRTAFTLGEKKERERIIRLLDAENKEWTGHFVRTAFSNLKRNINAVAANNECGTGALASGNRGKTDYSAKGGGSIPPDGKCPLCKGAAHEIEDEDREPDYDGVN